MYEDSFDLWAKVFKAHPALELDSPSASDIMDEVEDYVRVLEQLDLSLMDADIESRFPLWDLVEMNDSDGKFSEYLLEHKRRRGINP